LEEFDERHDNKDRFLNVLNELIDSEPTVMNLKIAAECIKSRGAWQDLQLLNKYKIQGAFDEVLKIKNDAQYHVYRKILE